MPEPTTDYTAKRIDELPQSNSVLGAPETLDMLAPDAASSMIPAPRPPPRPRGRY